ncbi:MAG: hypothetical protein QM535_18850, partial [Limnohabitans sp.]|nr:hypothetical protein [Limnohabitans sp.]
MERSTGHNSTFAIGGDSFSAESFVLIKSFVLRIKICGKNPTHRKSANRCLQFPLLEQTELQKQANDCT